MKQLYSYFIPFLLLVCSACGSRTGRNTDNNGQQAGNLMQYAENLTIVKKDSFTQVVLKNPWKEGTILHTYLLVPKNAVLPTQLPKGTLIRTPITKAVINPSMHCKLFEELGVGSIIKGVCGLEYIKIPSVIKAAKRGEIIDCGSGMNPDIEKIIRLHPEAILLSPFENSGGYGRVDKLNIPIVECADYMETSPLGRAEWMRFYGLLCGKEKETDSLFNEIVKDYNELRTLAREDKASPTVFTELKYGSVWYVPGGNSTTGKILADAHATYQFAHLDNSGSKPLPFETVFQKAHQSQFWLFKYNQVKDKTLKELGNDFGPYTHFDAYKQKQVYGCNTNYTPFYEETPFHPERLLKDLIKIFHPQLLPDYSLRYYTRIADR